MSTAPLAPPLPGQELARDPRRLQRSSYPLSYTFALRWSDTEDGHLSRVAISQFFEDVRPPMMRDILGYERMNTGTWRAVLRAITVEHLGTMPFGAPIEVAGGIAAVGGSSYTFSLAAFHAGRCLAVGRAVGVTVDATMRPAPIPADVREALSHFMWPSQGAAA